MALTLHKILKDGFTTHEDFSQVAWESAMRDPGVARHWGHPPRDCHDPVARHWARLRREGYPCGPKQHAHADRDDPGWAGVREIELVKTPVLAPPRAGPPGPPPLTDPVSWPPESPLTPQLLSQMSGMAIDDAKDILAAPRKELPPTEVGPMADKRGQFLLF